jgi:hypothetical protein
LNLGALESTIALPFAGGLLLAAGVALLRLRWLAKRGTGSFIVMLGGWLALIAGFVAFSEAVGAERGVTFALIALSLVGYLVVAWTAELRTTRVRQPGDVALEPEARRTNWPRGIAKSLLAIVLAGIASIGLGVAFAVAMPLAPQDRIVIGGLLVPILWGGGMAWTLADPRLVRATVILLTISAIGYGIAFLPRVLP